MKNCVFVSCKRPNTQFIGQNTMKSLNNPSILEHSGSAPIFINSGHNFVNCDDFKTGLLFQYSLNLLYFYSILLTYEWEKKYLPTFLLYSNALRKQKCTQYLNLLVLRRLSKYSYFRFYSFWVYSTYFAYFCSSLSQPTGGAQFSHVALQSHSMVEFSFVSA